MCREGETGGEGIGAEVDHHPALGGGDGRGEEGVEEEDVERDSHELERRDREALAVLLRHGDVPEDPVAVASDADSDSDDGADDGSDDGSDDSDSGACSDVCCEEQTQTLLPLPCPSPRR